MQTRAQTLPTCAKGMVHKAIELCSIWMHAQLHGVRWLVRQVRKEVISPQKSIKVHSVIMQMADT